MRPVGYSDHLILFKFAETKWQINIPKRLFNMHSAFALKLFESDPLFSTFYIQQTPFLNWKFQICGDYVYVFIVQYGLVII